MTLIELPHVASEPSGVRKLSGGCRVADIEAGGVLVDRKLSRKSTLLHYEL